MYSDRTRFYLMNPQNGRVGDHYNAFGHCVKTIPCRSNPDRISTNTVDFWLWVDDLGKIHEARWHVWGDPVAMATASWCVEHITGKFIRELVHLITPERISLELEITDSLNIRSSCMAVIEAIMAAVDDYSAGEKDRPPKKV